jgi:hypothetical protein
MKKEYSTTNVYLIANQTTEWIYHPPWGRKSFGIQPSLLILDFGLSFVGETAQGTIGYLDLLITKTTS